MKRSSLPPSTEYYPSIHSIFLPDEVDLKSATLTEHVSKAQNEDQRASTSSKRPSILPRRESLPPPPRPKSASSRSSYQSSHSSTRFDVEREGQDLPSSNDVVKKGDMNISADSGNLSSDIEQDIHFNDEPEGSNEQEGLFEILKKEELNRIQTLSNLEGSNPTTRPNLRNKHNHLSLDYLHNSSENKPSIQSDRECDIIPKTPRTPKQFLQDHFEIKTPKLPLPIPFSSNKRQVPIPLPVPTHINLPTPIMPIIHILLIVAHMVLSALIPFLLFKNMIQPLVLWIITTVTVVLQCVYLLPGITLEVIGILRRRPIDSAWLQSGLHLVILILSLIPHGATLFLLIVGNQLPKCPSAFIYKPPELPNFESHLRLSACEQLPKVTMIATANLIIVAIEVVVTSVSVAVDYRIQRKDERRHSKILLDGIGLDEDEKEQKKKRRKTWWKEKDNENAYRKIRRRRWTTGTGKLLWDIEGYIHRKKAQQHEEKSV